MRDDKSKKYKFYKRGQILYVDFGNMKVRGRQGGIRPCVVVSNNASNHERSPIITVCPISTKLKDIIVHVTVLPKDVKGYPLSQVSQIQVENIKCITKEEVISVGGYIKNDSDTMKDLNKAIAIQFNLIDRKNAEGEKSAEEK